MQSKAATTKRGFQLIVQLGHMPVKAMYNLVTRPLRNKGEGTQSK